MTPLLTLHSQTTSDLDHSEMTFDDTAYPGRCAIHQSSSSRRSSSGNFASRIRSRLMMRNNSKFADILAREEQRRLAEEIKDCKNCVKNLENSYKMQRINSKGAEDDISNHSKSRRRAFARLLSRDHAAATASITSSCLSEQEVQYYERELEEQQAKAAMVSESSSSSKGLLSSVRRGSSLLRVVHHHHRRQGHDLHRS